MVELNHGQSISEIIKMTLYWEVGKIGNHGLTTRAHY